METFPRPAGLALLDLTLPTPEENLALDEALLLAVEEGQAPPTLRLWEWPDDLVVVGSSSRLAREVNLRACRRDGVPVLRRCSGGCAVLLGRGCLNFALALPKPPGQHLAGIAESVELILGRLADVLRTRLPGVRLCGTSDLALHGHKISGNSQRWLRSSLLHHGTLLYDFRLEKVSRYLTLPERQPDYRRGRSHQEFLTNLPLLRGELRDLLQQAWPTGDDEFLSEPLRERVSRLAAEKYRSERWILRR